MAILKKLLSRRISRSKAMRDRRLAPSPAGLPSESPTSNTVSRIIILLFSVIAVWGACAVNIFYRSHRSVTPDYVLGQRVHTDVYAETDFNYEDVTETTIKRQQEENTVLDIYRLDEAANEVSRQYFSELFDLLDLSITASKPQHELPDGTSEIVASAFLSLDQHQKNSLSTSLMSADKRNFLTQHLGKILLEGVIAEDEFRQTETSRNIWILDEHRRKTKSAFKNLHTPESVASHLAEAIVTRFRYVDAAGIQGVSRKLFVNLIIPNLTFERSLTEKERQAASDSIPPVKKWISEGTLFLPKGTLIAAKDLMKLEAHDRSYQTNIGSSEYYQKAVTMLILTLLTIAAGALFIYQQHPTIFANKFHIILVALTVVLNILLARALEGIMEYSFNTPRMLIYPLLPLALSSVFLTLLLGKNIGLSIGIFSSLLIALADTTPDIHIFVLGMFSSCAGVVAIRSARTRTQTFRGAIAIALTVLVVEIVVLALKSTPWPNYFYVLAVAIGNGLIVLILANLLLPVTEYLFGITTDISLLELSDLNQPLLKRLQMEAPGTYHHTLMVATISEHAVEAIGGNALLARVATYFHDIGKLSNPTYFTENSFGIDRHEDLSPRMSSLIILNHVKEGLAMATKHKLRKPIRDVIASHHGTSLVYYFYQRAKGVKSETDNDRIAEEDFRYPGPLPVSKEASIISLADSCEAASRSLQKPTPQKINTLVSEIFRNRILDGQLNDSELSMSEIHTVEDTIIKTLTTMLHGRIAYPKLDDNESQSDKPADGAQIDGQEKADPDGSNGSEGSDVQQSEDISATA